MNDPAYFERILRQDPNVLLIVADLVRERMRDRFRDEPLTVRDLSTMLSKSQIQATPWCKFENIPVPKAKRFLYRISRHLENGRVDALRELWTETVPRSRES